MRKSKLVLPSLVLLAATLSAQQTKPQNTPPPPIPAEAVKEPNPVKSTPESLARAKKWWAIDCVTCHGKEGEGKTDTAKDMKLTMPDFTAPATLKDKTDGELFDSIKNGHLAMPAEGQRIKTEDGWDVVNYVRSLVKTKPASDQNLQTEQKSQ